MRFICIVISTGLFVGVLSADDSAAWQSRVKQGPAGLPAILKELDTANPTRANWLRTAADAIVENELNAGRKLDVALLTSYLKDTSNAPRSRRMVYEWLCRIDPETKARYIASFLNDPSLELRRDAVADALAKLPKEGDRKAGLRAILNSARDRDQVDAIAKELKALGDEVDLAAHFGFIRNWAVLSQFDNTGEKGFAVAYAPEKEFDWKMQPAGKDNKPTEWKKITSVDPYGKMNLAKDIGKHKSAIAYAVTIVKVDKPTKVDLRANTLNAIKVWLNGKEVIAHEEYHHGDNMDQYIGQGELKAGENLIMVKVCQNDQKESWAQSWEFALRVCDNLGTAVKLEVVPAPIK
ncbi:MAG: HEAT repeat domain-containing protein [Gemmatales bacterium]